MLVLVHLHVERNCHDATGHSIKYISHSYIRCIRWLGLRGICRHQMVRSTMEWQCSRVSHHCQRAGSDCHSSTEVLDVVLLREPDWMAKDWTRLWTSMWWPPQYGSYVPSIEHCRHLKSLFGPVQLACSS